MPLLLQIPRKLENSYRYPAHTYLQLMQVCSPHSHGEGVDVWGSVPRGISVSSPDCLPEEVMV